MKSGILMSSMSFYFPGGFSLQWWLGYVRLISSLTHTSSHSFYVSCCKVILVWLVEKGFDVICFCANVGQGDEDYEAIKRKVNMITIESTDELLSYSNAQAISCGASKIYVEDLRREFVTDFVYPAVKCNAIYESRYILGTSIARPCIGI